MIQFFSLSVFPVYEFISFQNFSLQFSQFIKKCKADKNKLYSTGINIIANIIIIGLI